MCIGKSTFCAICVIFDTHFRWFRQKFAIFSGKNHGFANSADLCNRNYTGGKPGKSTFFRIIYIIKNEELEITLPINFIKRIFV